MGKGQATRAAIVDEALRRATVVGLEGVSLGPLADRMNLTKSGLFAHFKSKEVLQLQVVDTAIERFKRDVVVPANRSSDPEERLTRFFAHWLTWIRSVEDYGGCVFMTMAQEYDDKPGAIRDRLAGSQKDMRAYLAEQVRRGITEGAFRPDADPEQWVFELYGMALSFQHAANLLEDRSAKRRAMAGFARLMDSLRA